MQIKLKMVIKKTFKLRFINYNKKQWGGGIYSRWDGLLAQYLCKLSQKHVMWCFRNWYRTEIVFSVSYSVVYFIMLFWLYTACIPSFFYRNSVYRNGNVAPYRNRENRLTLTYNLWTSKFNIFKWVMPLKLSAKR